MSATAKSTLKQRVEELHSKRRELLKRPAKPQWLSKPRILQHMKGVEMISLDRGSDFAKIPAELQLHIISYLDYPDVRQLKKTCRYFNYFINEDVMKESKKQQVERYQQMELQMRTPANKLPCYKCLRMKQSAEFYNAKAAYYLNAQPSYYTRANASPAQDFNRHCIRCSFRNGLYDPGLKVVTGGETWQVCAACGVLCRDVQYPAYSAAQGTCKPCGAMHEFNKKNGATLRLLQFVIAVVILPLACTGQAMPWTSRADEHSLRWIFTVTLDLLTIGGCFASLCTRLQNSYGAYNHKRSENHRFIFLVEIAACLCWLGVLASLFNEGHQRHFTGRFDRFAKGLIAMTFVESLLFIGSALLSHPVSRRWLIPGTRVPKNEIV